jgi:hypothetical protein
MAMSFCGAISKLFQGYWIEGMLGDHFVEVLYRNTPFFNEGHAF